MIPLVALVAGCGDTTATPPPTVSTPAAEPANPAPGAKGTQAAPPVSSATKTL